MGAPWKPSVWTPAGWAQSPWRGELTAGLPPSPRPAGFACRSSGPEGRGSVPGEGELPGLDSTGEGRPWCWHPLSPGDPRACARAHLRAWALSGQESFGSTNCHYSVRPTWGPAHPGAAGGHGKVQIASRMCSGVTARGPVSVLSLSSQHPALLPATPPLSSRGPTLPPPLLSRRFPA